MPTDSSASEPQLSIRNGFRWDAQDAYLFDIDGTLLRTRDRIHFDAFASSIRAITGHNITLQGVLLHGGTDTAILAEAFANAGVPLAVWAPHRQAILDTMCRAAEARRQEFDILLMPAVETALAHLTRRGALLGLATGNLEQIGWLKVELAGLRSWFHFGGFSDRFPLRAELVADAANQARQRLANPCAGVCVVGDTPRDIQAAHANRLPVIAVATGSYSFADLAALGPEICASSLQALLSLPESQAPAEGPR